MQHEHLKNNEFQIESHECEINVLDQSKSQHIFSIGKKKTDT